MSAADNEFIACARWIIPVVPSGQVLTGHALVVANGEIVDLLPADTARQRYGRFRVIDLPDHIVTPGFVNAHGHAAMTLLRGYSDDRELMDWLNNHIWPVEGRYVDYDFAYDGTALAIAEMIRTGTTCAADTYFFPEAMSGAYRDNHFRAQVCLPVIQFPNAWAQTEQEHIAKGLALHEVLKNEPLITTAFAPHAPYTVTDDGFRAIRKHAERLDVPIHLHLHETATEVMDAVSSGGMRPFARMESLGLMNERLQTIHMTQLDDREIETLARVGAHVAHCPESNMKLASGFCRVGDLIAAGVNVAIGTDGAASNNNLDMIEEMRSASLLAKAVASDATAVGATKALEMATLGGARMLGLGDKIGSLEAGKRADFIAVDVSALNFQPMHHPVSQLVYTTSGFQVSDVWIDGTRLLERFAYTRLDADGLRARVADWNRKIAP
ncbi:MAG: TRZ/ATZ family hydrolase [Pseudomonadales bacterium]|nr:TRZ/ATZ family hydrolase [Pseudomonadales bacterium]